MGDETAAAGDDAPDGFASLWIGLEWWITHLLLHLKTARGFLRTGRDGFVNVGGHGSVGGGEALIV